MSSWTTENYQMQNIIGMHGIQNMMTPSIMTPMYMGPEMTNINMPMQVHNSNNMNNASAMSSTNLPSLVNTAPPVVTFGQVAVESDKLEETNLTGTDNAENSISKQSSSNRDRDRSDSRRDKDRERSRRPRSRDRYNRNDRDRKDRSRREHRDRRSKWDNDKNSSDVGAESTNMIMPGTMMQYNNLLNTHMVAQQPLDMANVQNMIPGMAMMPNILDQNIIMHQQMMQTNQPIYVTNGVFMSPLPGTSMPSRREKPPGCRTIFVGGLPQGINQDIIQEVFQRFGEISNVKLHRQGVYHVRFERHESVENSFMLSGYRFKYHNQNDNEATTLFIDYALNRDDQIDYERNWRERENTPPRLEPFSPAALAAIADKIKSEHSFIEAAPSLAAWLERGECNKRNANAFYSLIQATNNQIRRLCDEKMTIDEEYQTFKSTMRDKYVIMLKQFEQVVKILSMAKHQRVSDHFTKQQRRNIEMWQKMAEEVDNIREEFNSNFNDEDTEKIGKEMVPKDKYEELTAENESLIHELEGYKNEAHLAKYEAERKFEKFKAHFIAQQALQNNQQKSTIFPPLPPPPMPNSIMDSRTPPLLQTPDSITSSAESTVSQYEAKLISMLTAFLMVHPLGVSIDNVNSYVKSMVSNLAPNSVHNTLNKYKDIFKQITGKGEQRWYFFAFDVIKNQI